MRQSYPGLSSSVSDWKGQDIVNFQEELLIKVNAHISEKWFYTHMKSGHDKLPRIDMLNLLSKYAGYTDWNDFVYKNSQQTNEPIIKSGNRYFIIVPLLVVGIIAVFYLLFKLMNTREYNFCFYDADTKEAITNSVIEISLLKEGESAVKFLSGENGCFTLKTDQLYVEMVVSAPYYRGDTIKRTLRKFNRDERFALRANEYAMMLRFFSEGNTGDWQKRRTRLEAMFDDAAMIYQVHDDHRATGMELLSKWEFIDKMTMPSHNLKRIDILDTKYMNEKIMVLRYRIATKQE